MKKLTPATLAILKAMINGATLEYQLESHTIILNRNRRKLTLHAETPQFGMMYTLLNRAFDVLSAQGYIRLTHREGLTGPVRYSATPKAAQYLKGLAL